MNIKSLSRPFDLNQIDWRVGAMTKDQAKGIGLAYIDARCVMDRLDEVCGMENWKNEHPIANGKTSCRISIRINDEWVYKENGAGDSAVEAEKGAFSDSLKRAAVLWGIGRYLYDMPNIWVPLENKKITEEGKKQLEKSLSELTAKKYPTLNPKLTAAMDKIEPKDKAAAGALGGSIKSHLDEEQIKEMYDQAIKRLNSCSTADRLKNEWVAIYKNRTVFSDVQYLDLEQKKDEMKSEIEKDVK